MLDSPDLVQLTHSKKWVPKLSVFEGVRKIYAKLLKDVGVLLKEGSQFQRLCDTSVIAESASENDLIRRHSKEWKKQVRIAVQTLQNRWDKAVKLQDEFIWRDDIAAIRDGPVRRARNRYKKASAASTKLGELILDLKEFVDDDLSDSEPETEREN